MSELITDPSKRITADDLIIATLDGDGSLYSGSQTVGPVLAGTNSGFGAAVTPEFGGITVYNFTAEVRVDTDDANHVFPYGASLTSAQLKTGVEIWGDSGQANAAWSSDDMTGRRLWTVSIANRDSNTHTYYVRIKVYGLFGF